MDGVGTQPFDKNRGRRQGVRVHLSEHVDVFLVSGDEGGLDAVYYD